MESKDKALREIKDQDQVREQLVNSTNDDNVKSLVEKYIVKPKITAKGKKDEI